MGHTPYGYRIENGVAVIDKAAAEQVRTIYMKYLDGLSLVNAAKEAGLSLKHSGVKRILCNKHYLGDSFYPQIIDKASFDAAEAELNKRSAQLGRDNRRTEPKKKKVPTAFLMRSTNKTFDNPIRQAEYMYSLIESEVI